ncbi:MAG: family 10 glycosylhydrolase [Parcubacteria group bacterium]|nr:family 10 glycosylhydrolase [Parcubacteria group bacterium]
MLRTVAVLMALLLVGPIAAATPQPPDKPLKTNALWIELGANLLTLSDPQKTAALFDKIKTAGFTMIVIEAKSAAGFTAYPSKFAPHISKSNAPRKSLFNPYDAPSTWLTSDLDILRLSIDAARARNLKVCAAINTFSEGINLWKDGAAYQGMNPEWLATYYAASRKFVAPNGQELSITAVNIGRTIFGIATGRIPDNAVLYTIDPPPISKWATGWALDGAEVVVAQRKDQTLFVEHVVEWSTLSGKPYTLRVPAGGFILSLHGQAYQWVTQNLKKGDVVTMSPLKTQFVKSTDAGIFAFTNPNHPEVQARALAIIGEIASDYKPDCIVLDRIRYAGALSDFSSTTEKSFEEDMGKPVKWPGEVIGYGRTPAWFVQIPGRRFPSWTTFRARVIRNFVARAQETVKGANPSIEFSAYVGGWYPVYYEEATNWARQGFRSNYWWTNREWPTTGTSGFFDHLFVGLYYRNLTIKEARSRPIADADWASLEGGMPLARSVTQGRTPLLGGLNLTDYEDRPQALKAAIVSIRRGLGSVMIFDAVYLEALNLWDEVTSAFTQAQP